MTNNTSTCSTCGQVINEVIFISGKPYGTTCAERVLGIKNLPSWFKGGNWDEAKIKHEKSQEEMNMVFDLAKKNTSEFWGEWLKISKVYHEARKNGNEWVASFAYSVCGQLGYYSVLPTVEFKTMEEASENWKPYLGTFPILHKKPKSITSLSHKQLSIISKYF
jgi:hypothetical protein